MTNRPSRNWKGDSSYVWCDWCEMWIDLWIRHSRHYVIEPHLVVCDIPTIYVDPNWKRDGLYG